MVSSLLLIMLALGMNGLMAWKLGYLAHSRHGFGQAALKPGVMEKLEELKTDYNDLLNKYDLREVKGVNDALLNPEQQKLKNIRSCLDCVEALRSIEDDLTELSEQMKDNDEKVRERAGIYFREFTQCRDEIEEELNQLFA